MSEWQQGFTELGIHYTRTGGAPTGGEKPPLILAHGFTDNGLCWTRTAQAFEDDYDVIMPDARGHGLSPLGEGDYTGERHADELAALIAELNLGRPPIVGHSMGAFNAFATAAQHPDCVRAIVLVDPPWHIEPEPPDTSELHKGWRDNVAADKQRSDSDLLARIREEGPNWHEIEITTKFDAIRQVDIRVFERLTLSRREWRDVLPEIQCPALLLWADHGIVNEEVAAAAAELAPTLTARRIADAGHCIQRDQFDAFIGAVRDFLEEL